VLRSPDGGPGTVRDHIVSLSLHYYSETATSCPNMAFIGVFVVAVPTDLVYNGIWLGYKHLEGSRLSGQVLCLAARVRLLRSVRCPGRLEWRAR
jgi:hypothetical protein